MQFEKKAIGLVFLFSTISIIYSFISALIVDLYFPSLNIGGPKFKSIGQEIFVALIFAPFVETLIYQALPFSLLGLIKLDSKYFSWIYIGVSGILFACAHEYSATYFYLMICPGVFLAYFYLYFQRKYKYPILYLFLIHMIHNLFIFLMQFF